MKISDEIRNDFLCNDDVGEVAYRQLLCIADRIDRKMVELPKDADGVTIRIGDVVYGSSGVAWVVVGLRMSKFGWKVEMDNVPFRCEPDDLTHKNPRPNDSLERIADELESAKGWCDQNGDYGTGIVSIGSRSLCEWSDRIRKLAKKEGGDAHGN